MLRNYVKIAFRNLKKQKGYSFINISGLAIGLTAFMLIYFHVRNELDFEKHNANYDNIYRVVEQQHYVDRIMPVAVTPVPLSAELKADYPEILESTRYTGVRTSLVEYEDVRFYENGIQAADQSFLDIFTLPLLKGNMNTALAEPNTALISKEIAKKYFVEEEPIGKFLLISNDLQVSVTGVFDDLPHNSFLQFDILISFPTIEFFNGPQYLTRWGSNTLNTFILLPEYYDYTELEEKIFDDLSRYREREGLTKLHLQPLKDMHFETFWVADFGPKIERKYIWIFIAVAVSILIIACINFMNLSTARSANRAAEIGMRKVVGARRFQLIKQFISESVLLALISFAFSIALARILMPFFDTVTGNSLTASMFSDLGIYGQFFLLAVIVGIIAGSYPALFLSSFVPVKVLKGTLQKGSTNTFIRKGLVVAQFSISIALITSTIVIYQQLNYLNHKDLGFNKEQIVMVPVRESMTYRQREAIKLEISQNARVINTSAMSILPGFGSSSSGFSWEGSMEGETILLNQYRVDYDFVNTMEMDIVEGRNFSRDFASDTLNAVLLNETAVNDLAWTTAVGKKLNPGENALNVIGVVKDFHFLPLHRETEPLVIYLDRGGRGYISAKISTEQVSETITYIEKTWNSFAPGKPFEYFFLDSRFDDLYKSVNVMQQMFGFFSMLTIFIASLGLFGLASFTAEQRTKEIGIRKVLGASVSGIINLLSVDFLKQVAIANVIAVLIAYTVMTRWLEDFAYRIDISIWSFFFAGIIALVIAMLTIGYQSVKAAYANPVDALKYE